ncbi:MAG: MarR family transcriptional regulator [Candidatus Hydrogenedentes bacterium]|nr:MarR family transcriptional regulator [Candidatus Hydrogenedentota bacterium]
MNTEEFKANLDAIATECLAVRVRMLSRVVTKIYDEELRPLHLKASQMNILVAAAKMGVARPVALCELLHLDVSTLSRNVERMRQRGWLEVVPEAEDARAQPFRLTAEGRTLLQQAVPRWKEAQEKTRRMLGDGVVNLLGKTFKQLQRAKTAS